MNSHAALIEELPVLQRLALSYAPASVRSRWAALLALDARLGAILRASREPMLAQLRFAWWREQLQAVPSFQPAGEPLLAALRSWEGRLSGLAVLVDGWERLTGAAPLPGEVLAAFAQARGAAFGALAELLGAGNDAAETTRLGTNWALADLLTRLSHPEERKAAALLAQGRDWRGARISRRLRPLVVLHGLAARTVEREGRRAEASPTVLLAAMRLGLLGR